jgi:hypothetical protein
MKIINAKTYKYKNASHLQFILEVVDLIKKFGFILSRIGDLFNVLTASAEREDLSYKIIQKSNISDRKAAIDSARDTVIVGIKHSIKAGLRHFDDAAREAAQRLKIVFDTYDKPTLITNLPYDEETVSVNNLIQELKGKYASDTETLGLTPWITKLQEKNDEFELFVKDYTKELSEKPKVSLIDARKESDANYQKVITLINALMVVENDTALEYEPFVVEMNSLIKRYNDNLAKHIGRLQANRESEDGDEKK